MSRFDLTHPPFDLLTPPEIEALEACADVLFFADDQDILLPGQQVEAFYLVMKGIVREMGGEDTIGVYREHDSFDSRALVAGKTTHRFVAHEEALLCALPRDAVMALTEKNLAFGAHFFDKVSEKLGMAARRRNRHEWQSLLTATIRDVGIRPPVFIDGDTTVAETARMMKARRCRSVLVRDGAPNRIGIFTTSDFRDLVIDGVSAEVPVKQRARFELLCCDENDHLFDALLLMTRQNVQRVVVTANGEPVGVLAQVDLLSYFSNHSHLIAQRIELAKDVAALKEAAQGIDGMIETLVANGMRTPQLARLVQALNMRLMARLWSMVAPPEMFAESCLLVLGSEGRGEQILKTDQDNALIVAPHLDEKAVAEAANAFSAALADFGYPPCDGGVMVNNPQWRGTVETWRERLHRWVHRPEGEDWMHLAMFLDAEAVAGNSGWLAECKQSLTQWARHDAGWLGRLARPIEQFDHSGGFWQQWLNRDSSARLDLKKAGIFPVVHGARVLAFEAGIDRTNTFDRLRALAEHDALERELADDVAEALAYLMKLRLEARLEARRLGQPADNVIDTSRLSTLDRDLLKDALAVVKRFKAMLNHHYQLDRF